MKYIFMWQRIYNASAIAPIMRCHMHLYAWAVLSMSYLTR